MMKALLLTVSLLLTGCYATADRTPIEHQKTNEVSQVFLVHDVAFAWGQATPSEVELARLSGFLAEIDLSYGDEVVLRGGSAEERTALYRRLLGYGVPLMEARGTDKPGRVRVVVQRHVVTPPRCPDWSKEPGNDYRNTPGPNLGCANTVNLGRMVANPGDLVQGRESRLSDGEVMSTAVRRYRLGQTKALETSETATTGGDQQ